MTYSEAVEPTTQGTHDTLRSWTGLDRLAGENAQYRTSVQDFPARKSASWELLV